MPRLLFTLLVFLPATLLADWPQWRGPNRDGVADVSPPLVESLPDDGLQPIWLNKEVVSQGRGDGWSSPVVARGKVFLFGHGPLEGKKDAREEHVICLNASTGEQVWHNRRESRPTKFPQSGTPTVVENRLYLLGAGLTARCIDADSGEDIWTAQLPGEVNDECWMSSVAVIDDVAAVFAGRLFGLDGNTGDVLWQGDDVVKEGVYGSPAVFASSEQSLLVAHVGNGNTVCVEPATGKELWREKTEAVNSSPIIQGDLMITLGHSRKAGLRCYRLSESGAKLTWKYQRIADPGSCPVIVNEHVYVQGERRLACVRLSDGKQAWSEELDFKDPRYTSLIAADGQVIYALESLFTFVADPQEFRLLYRGHFNRDGLLAEESAHRKLLGLEEVPVSLDGESEADKRWREAMDAGPVSCTSPAFADGRLYVRLRHGLACYDLRQ